MAYTDSQWKDLLTAVDGQSITYDAIGNPINYYNGYTFTWAEGRRLQSATVSENQTYGYQYNADGLRTKKTNADGSYIVYHIAGGRYLGEIYYTATGAVDLYIRYNYDENGSVVGISLWNADGSAWTDYYFEKNLQGDILNVYQDSDSLPTLVASYTYDAWGNILSATGSLAEINPFRYRGYYYDAETEFYYLQSRYYDPAIGRFINADTFTSTGQGFTGFNMFAYCLNNPANFIDRTGTTTAGILERWTIGASWLPFIDTVLPVGDLVYGVGILVFGICTLVIAYYTPTPQIVLEEEKRETTPEPPDVTYPGDDPTKAPEGYEWKGHGEQGSKEGGYANKNGKDSWHPDLNHPDGIDPHWDYNDELKHKWRVFRNKIEFVK